MKHEVVWKDIGYKLVVEPKQMGTFGTGMGFKLYDEHDNSEGYDVVLEGSINVDGCGFVNTIYENKTMTLCGFDALFNFHQALLRTWSKAREMLSTKPGGIA